MAPAGSSGLFLGVSFEPHSLAVAEVLPGGPAYLAKLRKGDVIGAINEKPLQAVSDIPASLLRRNEIKLRRDERARNITIESANLHDERAVVALLLGKGDRISGSSSIKLFQRCDANCNCVDGGMACERWYL